MLSNSSTCESVSGQQQEGEVAGFVTKTFQILGVEEYQKIIYWSSNGLQFVIKDVVKFEQIVLPRYFRHKKINSFVRQLNMYGFHKMKHNNFKSTFKHEYFQKDRADLLTLIRRKPKLGRENQESGDQEKVLPEKQVKSEPRAQGIAMKQEEATMAQQKWANLTQQFLETTRMINMSLIKVSCNELSAIVNQIPEEEDCLSIEDQINDRAQDPYEFEDPSLYFA